MPRDLTYLARGSIFIPISIYEPKWKIVAYDMDGNAITVLDVPNNISNTISAEYSLTATENIGTFRVVLSNLNGQFLRKFNGGELVYIYMDDDLATTLKFLGKIDNVYYGLSLGDGFTVTIEGRQKPELVDDVTSISFYNASPLQCFIGNSLEGTEQDSNGNWNNGVLYNTEVTWHPDNVISGSATFTQTFENRSFWEIFRTICESLDLDFYIFYDSNWYIRVFNKETIFNENEYASYGENISSVGDFGYNNNDVKNNVVIYGKDNDNVIRIITRGDLDSQADLWKKTQVISDSNLTTYDQMLSKANEALTKSATREKSGNLTTLILPTLNPGETIQITIPYCDIDDTFRIKSFTQTYGSGGSFTSLEVARRRQRLSRYFEDALNIEGALTPYSNLNNMKDSIVLDFESTDKFTLVNCSITDGILRLDTGETYGTLTTNAVASVPEGDVTYSVSECELRIKANNFSGCSYRASNDDGITWETINPGVLHSFTSTGTSVRLEVTLIVTDGISPEFEDIGLLFK